MPSPSSSLATLSPQLTSYMEARFAELQDSGFIASKVFPVTPVTKASGVFGKVVPEEILKNAGNSERAPGSGYWRNISQFTTDTFACKEYGLEEPVDDREAEMLALARSPNELGRGREALATVQRAIAGLVSLKPEAAQVIERAVDVAGLPSAQADIDRGRLAASVGPALGLRDGPFELPSGVRLSTAPVFTLADAETTVFYASEASCKSCSADLEELARQVPKSARVLAVPPGDDQDQALRQVLALYRRPWPLLLGRDLEARLQLTPRTVLLVARSGNSQKDNSIT